MWRRSSSEALSDIRSREETFKRCEARRRQRADDGQVARSRSTSLCIAVVFVALCLASNLVGVRGMEGDEEGLPLKSPGKSLEVGEKNLVSNAANLYAAASSPAAINAISASADMAADTEEEPQPGSTAVKLGLPEPSLGSDSSGDSSDSSTGGHRKATLGDAIKFDHLGPIIINEDGTMRRIANWDILTEIERERALRLIAKRNEERRKALLNRIEEVPSEEDKNREEFKPDDEANEPSEAGLATATVKEAIVPDEL